MGEGSFFCCCCDMRTQLERMRESWTEWLKRWMRAWATLGQVLSHAQWCYVSQSHNIAQPRIQCLMTQDLFHCWWANQKGWAFRNEARPKVKPIS